MGTILSTGYDDGGSISMFGFDFFAYFTNVCRNQELCLLTSMLSATSSHSVLLGVLTAFFRCLPRCWMCALLKLDDGWPESEKDVC